MSSTKQQETRLRTQASASHNIAPARSVWTRGFDCTHIKPLIICRGPVRKEAIDAFAALGIRTCGMLLSDKDSIIHDRAYAPELRHPKIEISVHAVSDYSGATAEERNARIEEIIALCAHHQYDSVFAGYGFMAEDLALVSALERAGLRFIGPNSKVVYAAGFKDEAKRIATKVDISVTPGVDQLSALGLLRQHPTIGDLKELARAKKLKVDAKWWSENNALVDVADAVLDAGRVAGVELLTIDALCAEAVIQTKELFKQDTKCRLRLKAVGGGGGKGQRIIPAPESYTGAAAAQLRAALAPVESSLRDVLSEAKATGVRDNRNILIERNVENTRHQEIQMVGNGDWVITMGGRDCSLQMHQQKLLELSVTDEMLAHVAEQTRADGRTQQAEALDAEREILHRMEAEAERFASSVGLNSVSTFECIVADGAHYFMEVNTRIQVEHRVSELCYGLRFRNPKNADDCFDVDSLVELMVLLAVHGASLPKPERVRRAGASAEVRLNATNDALSPHAGGVIEYWSPPLEHEIRDDQGIGDTNPDTGRFLPYRLAGAYDSNIALLISTGEDRRDSLLRMAEVLRTTVLVGDDLATNLDFHRGLIHWFLGENPEARPSTAFVGCYLTLAGKLYEKAQQVDTVALWESLRARVKKDAHSDVDDVLDKKMNLLVRPLKMLLARPHLLSGWISHYRHHYARTGKKHAFATNSWDTLNCLYDYLDIRGSSKKEMRRILWTDVRILQEGCDFYRMLGERLPEHKSDMLMEALTHTSPPKGISAKLWSEIRAAHAGFQLGNELLLVPALLAEDVDFYALGIDEQLRERIPKILRNPKMQSESVKLLAPPPAHNPNEIVAQSGGMFYRREFPDLPPLVEEGQDFATGDPLCVIEVMKMFNKMHAPFSGTIEKVLVQEDGTVVKKGQPLYRVRPHDAPVLRDESKIQATRKSYTAQLLERMSVDTGVSV